MQTKLQSPTGGGFVCLILSVNVLWLAGLPAALAVDYYVSHSGDDKNSGRSPSSPWRTLDQVNRFAFAPGDVIHFQRGGVWHGQLVPRSGNEKGCVTYTAYGKGPKPQILGSIEKNRLEDWKRVKKNVWRAGPFPCDVGNIIFNNGEVCGSKVWTSTDVDEPYKFCYERESNTVLLYAAKNPAELFEDIECALTRHIIPQSGRHHVIYDGLHLAYGSAHGIGGGGTHHIVVRNCDLSFIGGGHQYTKQTPRGPRHVRYGNGVEFWNGAHDNLVENCRLWNIFDAALTNQGAAKNAQYNITYRRNIIWNCNYSFEYWNRPEGSVTHDIYFEDNLCFNAGEGCCHGWGVHLMFFSNQATTKRFFVRRNVFHNARFAALNLHLGQWDWSDELVLSDNVYVQPADKTLVQWDGRPFKAGEFAAYRRFSGKDTDSRLLTVRRLVLKPASVSLKVGQTQAIEAVAFYSDGTSVPVTPLARLV
ncbi:MAG: hypothetical protein GXP27_19865, partial [Planctomycetes bacterium]|nr:hypothetical protein [Planctomycetota bacterium]